MSSAAKKWYKLNVGCKELQLLGTLNGGQSFRWKNNNNRWTGVILDKVWVLQQEDNNILYQVHEKDKVENTELNYNKILQEYFQLNLSLEEYYTEWSRKDKYFKEASKQFYGIRILKQDLVENLFSFICSSNNNISRITGMVEKLATYYGEKICEIDGEKYYTFPKVQSLAQDSVEEKLKSNGFGYRAKYISKSAKYIVDSGGDDWIDDLIGMKYEEAKKALMCLTGIGAKVADCICLMSLGHLQAIPVDTHIYQIAKKFYLPKLSNNKTVTDKIYNEIGEYFRDLYGPLAGWAHTVLFCADLKKFQENNMEKEDDNSTKVKASQKKLKTKK